MAIRFYTTKVFFCQIWFYRFGIRCNAVLPGFIETPMTDAVPKKVIDKILPLIPQQRMGKPEGKLLQDFKYKSK